MDELQLIKNKIVPIDFLVKNSAVLAEKRVVFTNGCFDILHLGHIQYLAQAKSKGDILIIGLNSDNSVRKLKGTSRPINPENARAMVLAALQFVDFVVIFEEDTPKNLIQKIVPKVLVKGGDYSVDQIVGADFVIENRGTVETISFVDGYSTSNIIDNCSQSK